MDGIAEWMGLVKAMYYTNRFAWFTQQADGELKYVSHCRDFDPKIKDEIFLLVMAHAVQSGCEIIIARKAVKTSKYINIECVMTVKGQIYRSMGMNFQTAIVNCISQYVNNLNYEKRVKTN